MAFFFHYVRRTFCFHPINYSRLALTAPRRRGEVAPIQIRPFHVNGLFRGGEQRLSLASSFPVLPIDNRSGWKLQEYRIVTVDLVRAHARGYSFSRRACTLEEEDRTSIERKDSVGSPSFPPIHLSCGLLVPINPRRSINTSRCCPLFSYTSIPWTGST